MDLFEYCDSIFAKIPIDAEQISINKKQFYIFLCVEILNV